MEFLRLALTRYTRSHLAPETYDKAALDGASFADLATAGGPLLFINATDIDIGMAFTFI